ncbi:uncharacterized protein LOC131615107 [Vicia villosa]|uniref:uncharacterized protein LOC131615107 n=1 Tax=Vicia villosa TaxID=3911 RepID=UPI00273BC82C|nr:uncharacterized protein LOC131615107 [Vicia villosa]
MTLRRSRGRPPKTVPSILESSSLSANVTVVNRKEDNAANRTVKKPISEVETVQIEAQTEASQKNEKDRKLWVDVISDISMHTMKNFMLKAWNFIHLPDLYYNEAGYFILRFKQRDDLDAVAMKGPYTIRTMSLVLKTWRPDFNPKDDMVRTLPIWVKLPQLPLHLWGERSLNKIASAIGAPLVTDECTTHKLRVSYARMLIEVDITQKMLDEITITYNEGKKRKQAFEYEWRPYFCERCQKIGHRCEQERKQKVWQPKPQLKAD